MAVIPVFLLALALRLLLSPLGFHVDILSNAGWGQWIYEFGTKGFYQNNMWLYSWPTQPPIVNLLYGFDRWLYIILLEILRQMANLIVRFHLAPGHMIWFFDFVKWFDLARTDSRAAFAIGYLVTIKLPAIFADLGIALIIYMTSKNIKEIKNPIIWPIIYLFSPFSFYLSALWGQYDQLSFLPMLIAFILEANKKYPWLTPVLIAISFFIKPTSLIVIPLFVCLYLINHHKIKNFIISVSIILILYFASTVAFTGTTDFVFKNIQIFEKIFLKADSRLSANAFNFWRIIQSYSIQTQEQKILFIPAYVWALLGYIYLNQLAVKNIRKVTQKNVLISVFIVSAGSWLFMTNMLDRYFFTGVVSGLFVCLYYPKLLKYWIGLSLIFFLNLFNQWWFPDSFEPIKQILIWNGALVTKLLSLVNILIFLKMARKLLYN